MADAPAEAPHGAVELPRRLARTVRALAGLEEPPATFAEWMERAADRMEGPPVRLTTGDLYRDEPSPHEVLVDGDRRYVPCVLDALEVARLVPQSPVAIRSESPHDGAVVEIHVDGEVTGVTPDGAVMSFGVSTAHDLDGTGGAPPLASWLDPDSEPDVEPRICRYTNAFTSATAYEAWDERLTTAETVSMTFQQGWDIAKRATESPMFER